jgi:hypothetical protein
MQSWPKSGVSHTVQSFLGFVRGLALQEGSDNVEEGDHAGAEVEYLAEHIVD